jgi:copper resistance protein C
MLTRAPRRSSASIQPALRAARHSARRACVALLGISSVVLLLAPAGCLAHAIIVAAQPAMNSVVAPGEIGIRLEFNSRVDRKRSGLVLQGPDGSEAPLAIGPGSPPGVLEARTQVKARGRWKLRWQVLSLDGHITRGEVDFSVRDAIDPH